MAQQPVPLTPDQVKRYSRHIIMNDVGSRGQRKLMQSKVLILGAGGLGSPSAIYLSLAGVGTIGLVDFDVVDLSNLQRQILHHTADVGRPKLHSARDTIHAFNPEVNVILHETRLESDNAMEIIGQYDMVVNGRTTSLPGTWSTTPATLPESRWWTEVSLSSTARLPCSYPAKAATAVYFPRLLPREWCPTAPKQVSLAP